MPSLSRLELAACALLALAAVVLGVRHLQARAAVERPAAGAGTGREELATPVVEGPGARAEREVALVHVAGAVRDPGVVELRAGARVRDALRAAGGATGRAEVDRINLAAKVADGQQVVVPERPSGPARPGRGPAGEAPAGPVSLGSATLEQLDGLDGIGPGLAERIIAFREERGGFSSVDQLAEVPGIGPKRLEALREVVAP